MGLAGCLRYCDDRLFKAIEAGGPVSRLAAPLYDAANRTAALAMDRSLEATRFTGTVSGTPLSIIALGESHWATYLARRAGRLVPERLSAERLPRVGSCDLPQALERFEREADLVTTRVGAFLSARLGPRCFRIPEWVTFRYPLEPYEEPARIGGRSLRHSLQAVTRGRTFHRLSRGSRELRFFYDHMYLPTITARHGGEARLFDFSFFRRVFSTGGVMWLHLDGELCGGIAFDQAGRVLRARFLGVLEADERLYEEHVPACLYYHFIQVARDDGLSAADFGGSRPVLTDGLTTHKLAWRMVPRLKRDSHFYINLEVCRDTPAVRAFLAANPFFVRTRSGLGLVFFDDPRVEETKRARELALSARGDLAKVRLDGSRSAGDLARAAGEAATGLWRASLPNGGSP